MIIFYVKCTFLRYEGKNDLGKYFQSNQENLRTLGSKYMASTGEQISLMVWIQIQIYWKKIEDKFVMNNMQIRIKVYNWTYIIKSVSQIKKFLSTFS